MTIKLNDSLAPSQNQSVSEDNSDKNVVTSYTAVLVSLLCSSHVMNA